VAQPMLLEGHTPDDTRTRERVLQDEIQRLRSRVSQLEASLIEARGQMDIQLRGVEELRRQLSPLFHALGAVFGELDALAPHDARDAHGAPDARTAQVWENWKQRLGGLPAKAIDALLLHGEMNRSQLRIAVGCATRSVTDIVYKLNQAGLINKNGGKISLKEMR